MDTDKKRNLKYLILTVIGIILVLLVLLVSCSSYFANKNNTSETVATANDEEVNTTRDDSTTNTFTPSPVTLNDYLSSCETYYKQINTLIENSNYSKTELIDKLSDQERYINNFLSNPIKDTQTDEQIEYIDEIRPIIENQAEICGTLIDYYESDNISFLNEATEQLEDGQEELKAIKNIINN